MLTLLEIRRAEFNKNLKTRSMTTFHASGGVKYAWRKVSSLIAFSLAVYKFSSLGGFTCWVINPTYGFHSHSERSEESRELRVQQTQILSGSFEQSSQDDRGKCIELGSILTGLEGGCKTC